MGSIGLKFAMTVLCWLAAGVVYAVNDSVEVTSIVKNGSAIDPVNMEVTRQGAAKAVASVRVGSTFGEGTLITAPEHVLLTLISSNGNTITLRPGSSLRVGTISNKGERFETVFGKIKYSVTNALDFFEVQHENFIAAVEGTAFTVDVSSKEITFEHIEGEFVVSRLEIVGKEKPRVQTSDAYITALNPIVSYQLNRTEYWAEAGTMTGAAEYFKRQLALNRENNAGNDAIWRTLYDLGGVYLFARRYQEAFSTLQEASALAEAHYPKHHHRVATSLNNLAVAYDAIGDTSTAEDYLRRSLKLNRASHQKRPTQYTRRRLLADLHSLGDLARKQERLGEARTYYEEFFTYNLDNPRLHDWVAWVAQTLASLYDSLDEPAKAKELRALQEQRRKQAEAAFDPNSATGDALLTHHYNLGLASLNAGKHKEALVHLEAAKAEIPNWYADERDPLVVELYIAIGVVHSALGNEQPASQNLRKALAVARQLPPSMNPRSWIRNAATMLTNYLIQLAQMQHNQGNYQQAMEILTAATAESEQARLIAQLANIETIRGMHFANMGQLDKARETLANAVDLKRSAGDEAGAVEAEKILQLLSND